MADNNFIPWGETLKDLVSQTKCTPTIINNILRERGVFCTSSDKIYTVPNLITSLLSPEEAHDISSSIKIKEQLDRVNFRNYDLNKNVDILDAVTGLIEPDDLLKNDFVNYQISDFNDFTSLDGKSNDSLVLDFEVCRTDILDGWYKSDKFFKGRVEIKKDSDSDLTMNIKLNHSSPETKEIADKVISIIEESLISEEIIKLPEHGGRVLFDDFSNQDRVRFLHKLASNHTTFEFYYKKIDDVHFHPDRDIEVNEELGGTSLLEKAIEQFRVKGDLDDIITTKWKKIHPYIKVTKVIASYTVDYKTFSGECKISYEFSDYSKRKLENPELCINFLNLKLKGASSTTHQEVQSIIMSAIEKQKSLLLASHIKNIEVSKEETASLK